MTLSKDKLIASTDMELDGDSVVSFLRDADGNEIASTNGALHVVQQGSVTVQAADLDIRDLAFVTDKVDVSGSSNVAVTDGGGSLTVDGTVAVSSVGGTVTVAATDLDIRNLSAAQDSVTVEQGTSPWVISGQVDASVAAPNLGLASTATTVSTTAVPVVASPLAGRKKLIVQNLSNKAMYLGGSGVTISTGIRMAAGAEATFELGPSVALQVVGEAGITGTGNLRVLEIA